MAAIVSCEVCIKSRFEEKPAIGFLHTYVVLLALEILN